MLQRVFVIALIVLVCQLVATTLVHDAVPGNDALSERSLESLMGSSSASAVNRWRPPPSAPCSRRWPCPVSSVPCHVGLPADEERARAFGALPESPSPHSLAKVGLCTMMSLTYEAHTLPHWVAYHQLLGFDAIWIYVDDRGDGLSASERRALHRIVLQLPPAVTLRYVSMTPGVTHQPESVEHCLRAARADGFTWIAHWDGDEYVYFPTSFLLTVSRSRMFLHTTQTRHMPCCSINTCVPVLLRAGRVLTGAWNTMLVFNLGPTSGTPC